MPVLTRRVLTTAAGNFAYLVSAAASGGGIIGLTAPAADDHRVFAYDVFTGNPAGFSTTYNKGYGAVPINLAAAGAVTGITLKQRLRDNAAPGTFASPGTIIQDWVTVAGISALASGANAVTLTLPASTKFYLVDLALSNDLANGVTVSNPIGVGNVIAAAGQSLCMCMWIDYQQGSSDPGTYVTSTTSSGVCLAPNSFNNLSGAAATQWAVAAAGGNYRSAFAVEFMNRMVAKTGVVCALIGQAHLGQSIEGFYPYASASIRVDLPYLKNVLNLAGNKINAFIWSQGNTDALYNMQRPVYAKKLQDLIAHLASFVSGPGGLLGGFPRIIAPFTTQDSPGQTRAQYATIQGACLDVVAADSQAVFAPCLDNGPTADGAHPSGQARVHWARNLYRVVLGAQGILPLRQGPVFTGATLASGGVVTLAVAQDGGTALTVALATGTGQPVGGQALSSLANQIQVFNAGDTSTPLSFTLTSVSTTALVLTLASAPAAGQALDVRYRYGYSPSSTAWATALRDDVTDGDGLTYGRQAGGPLVDALYAEAVTPLGAAVGISTVAGQSTAILTEQAGQMRVAGTWAGTRPTGIDLRFDGGSYANAGAVIGNGGTWSAVVTAPAAGSHTIQARLTGTATASSVVSFTTATVASVVGWNGTAAVTGAVAVFDAAQLGTLFQNSNKTGAVTAPGQLVRYLADATGDSTNDLRQTGTAPRLAAATYNGLPAIEFLTDATGLGSGASLASFAAAANAAAGMAAADGTVLLVWRQHQGGNITNMLTLGSTLSSKGSLGIGDQYGTAQFNRTNTAGTNAQANAGNLAAGSAGNVTAGSAGVTGTVGQLNVALARYTASSGALAIKEKAQTEGTATLAGTSGVTWTTIWLNKVAAYTTFCEAVVWNRRLSDAERDQVLAWVAQKWGGGP